MKPITEILPELLEPYSPEPDPEPIPEPLMARCWIPDVAIRGMVGSGWDTMNGGR